MTATPKIYNPDAKRQAKDYESIRISSMDDTSIYGPEIYSLSFDEAVKKDLLSDYKVMILSVDEARINLALQDIVSNIPQEEGKTMEMDDLGKIIGSWKALKKDGIEDGDPIRTALAFSSTIRSSKNFVERFPKTVKIYAETFEDAGTDTALEAQHIDGSHNAATRNESLVWLQKGSEIPETCKVLSNVRCLSEGVDVPALDAILFLDPKQSQIDVIQSVGRVMRKAPGKKIGWVILPIVARPGFHTEKSLSATGRYKVIWQMLNALRSHDRNMDQYINKIDLGEDVSDKLLFIDGTRDKKKTSTREIQDEGIQHLNLGQIPPPLKAEIVRKCGTRNYWENWAQDISEIARKHILRLEGILREENTPERKAFQDFLDEIRDDLNPEISEQQAIEMLAQHIITGPVFDALFSGNRSFTSQNSISIAMEKTLSLVDRHHLDAESRSLQKFYEDIRFKAEGITTLEGKQNLIKHLYGDFFKGAFPKTVEKFGIFYTPVEIVDFIIHSVQHVLQKEFQSDLSNPAVDILDPFTGTGTFITRLIQSGLLGRNLERKYLSGIHANEIMLLAYYIACVNIEAVFHNVAGKTPEEYIPFPGSVLTDTLHLAEQDRDMIANLMKDNSGRRTRQKKRPIKVIVGNPPYSAKQKSEGDNAANTIYPIINQRIKETYLKNETGGMKASIYDSYIQSFRWSSDRLEIENHGEGIIAFITSAGWLTSKSASGFRRSLKEEFDKIYVFNLRGNLRVQGKHRKSEGENVFGIMTPVAITILIKAKTQSSHRQGQIFYYQYEDALKKKDKIIFLQKRESIKEITFEKIIPNQQNFWLSQGTSEFQSFIPMDKTNAEKGYEIFEFESNGIISGRTSWVTNFSKKAVISNTTRSMNFYNQEKNRINSTDINRIKFSVSKNSQNIKWNKGDYAAIKRKEHKSLNNQEIKIYSFRPFTKKWSYTDRNFSNTVYSIPSMFPNGKENGITFPNLIISISSPSYKKEFSCLLSKETPDRHLLGGAKNYPLYKYNLDSPENPNAKLSNKKDPHRAEGSGLVASHISAGPELSSTEKKPFSLFPEKKPKEKPFKEYAISSFAMQTWRKAYPEEEISEEGLFYHVYGILHSLDYRETYCNNLYTSLPKIPILEKFEDFKIFSEAGRKLANLHLNYETITPYSAKVKDRQPQDMNDREHYRVQKMNFVEKGDLTRIHYNSRIIIEDIPEKAWDYRLDGYPALKWVMNQQQVKTDKDSGIVNDPNDWANDTMNNPRYPLDLFLRIITVSLETLKIMEALPKLEIRKGN